ncbi:unnamed protein product [Mytilus coruscus]|uniref:MEGF10_11 n=1 Tax=Mytilus coruscus TaxID=42192 RepID=A0A6J8A5I3_MYTCO|nr:unnamed protein product [Mytilus coruscus]
MDISRLKSLRAGNRAAVTKVFKKKKLEEAIGDSQIDTEEVSTLLEAVEKKKKTLATIDEQILNAVESEDITDEILETDEYYLELEGKIRKFKKFLKPVAQTTSSILDSNAPEFVPYSNQFTHASQQLSQSSSTSNDESINASTQTIPCINIQRYRSLEIAIRVTAYVLRFIQNLRNSKDKRSIGFISVEERCKALKVLIGAVQQETFKDEIDSLNSSSQKKVPLNVQKELNVSLMMTQNVKKCSKGFYGRFCIHQCKCKNGDCDPIDGTCKCERDDVECNKEGKCYEYFSFVE